MEAVTTVPVILDQRQDGWIYSKTWDLFFIIGSALLVPVPFLLAWSAEKSGALTGEQSIDMVNLVVAGLVGGPHLFSTFTFTFLDRSFVRKHPIYTWSALLIPVGVIYLGLYHFSTLVFLFFTWASIHILHQLIYISDCYRNRTKVKEPWWSRWVDYGVITLGLYPVGFYKLEQGTFFVAGEQLSMPAFALPLHLSLLATTIFFSFVAIWIFKTFRERANGQLNVPKTLLIGVTAIVCFLLPLGHNLDILFQGFNTWHSFQYLFLFWLINRLRLQRGEIDNGFVRKLVKSKSILPYYFFFLATAASVMVVVMIVRAVTPLKDPDQSYLVVVLSVLLMHYYFDHFLFTRTEYVR